MTNIRILKIKIYKRFKMKPNTNPLWMNTLQKCEKLRKGTKL